MQSVYSQSKWSVGFTAFRHKGGHLFCRGDVDPKIISKESGKMYTYLTNTFTNMPLVKLEDKKCFNERYALIVPTTVISNQRTKPCAEVVSRLKSLTS